MDVLLIAAGIAAAAYGASVMLVWSGTSFFVVWYALGAVLAGAGAAMRLGLWARLPGWLRLGAGVAGTAALVVVAALAALVMGSAREAPPAGLDYLVVLGAQVRADGRPSDVLRRRLDAAADYLAENPGTICVVSGGQGPNEPCTEAECMARYLVGRGVDEGRVVLEDRSTNTVENVRLSREAIVRHAAAAETDADGATGGEAAADGSAGRPHAADPAEQGGPSVGIVTNDFHVWRALAIARRQGLRDVHGIAAPSNPWYLPNNVLRECLGVAKDFLAGNL